MATLEQRVSYIESKLDSLATKEDLANLKAELKGDLNKIVMWLAGLQLLGLGAVAAIMKFLGG